MVSVACETRLLAFFAVTLCILPIIHSLSIPPPRTIKVIRRDGDDSSEDTSTTSSSTPIDSNGFDDLVLDEIDDTVTSNPRGNISVKSKPVLEVIDIVFQPFRPPSILVTDFFAKSNETNNSTTGSSSEENVNTDSSELTNSKRFKGTSMPFTATSSRKSKTRSSEENSQEKHGGINSSVDSEGRDNNDVSSTANRDNGIPFHKPRIGTVVQKSGPTSQMTSSSLNAQKQFSMDNNENSDDDARGMSDKRNNPADASNDDETGSPSTPPLAIEDITFTTSSPAGKSNGNSDASSDDNNNQRRKRETHQMGNISNEDHDHDDAPSSPSKKLTGKAQPDDNNSDNVRSSNGADDSSPKRTSTSDEASADEDNDMEEDDGHHETADGHKSGTVKVFLEILQLIPLSNSSTLTRTNNGSSNDEPDEESSSAFTPSQETTTITPPNHMEDTTGTAATVVHSMKANSNQKISAANSLPEVGVASEKKKELEKTHDEVVATRRRVARSATAKPENEKKGNPSTSPTTSASPSSRATSKPLTGKDAPAAHSPSANTLVATAAGSPAKKASSTAPDDAEGPPLENVTEPTGKSDDD